MARAVLPGVPVTKEAATVLRATEATVLGPSIATVEGVGAVGLPVLSMLGVGSAKTAGQILAEAGSAKAKATLRESYAEELFDADASLDVLLGTGGNAAADRARALVAIARMLAGIVSQCQLATQRSIGSPGGVAPLQVVAETEEERTQAMPGYATDTVKEQKERLRKMYNIRLRPFQLPKHAVLKKVAYWVKEEGQWPDPTALPLSKFKMDPTDSKQTMFERKMYATMTVAAGETVPAGVRDDGAGATTGFGVQWLNGELGQDLLVELSEHRDRLAKEEPGAMGRIVEMMDMAIAKGTEASSNESASLAIQKQMPEVAKYLMQYAATGEKRRLSGQQGEERPPKKKPKKQPKEKTPRGSAAAAKLLGAGAGKAGKEEGWKPKWPDEDGAPGPNGLPRMEGGNPSGEPCARFLKGQCSFSYCSYKHGK